MTRLDDKALAELQRLSDAATPSPWWTSRWSLGLTLESAGRYLIDADDGALPCLENDADAELIVAVRNALPSLLAEVVRLRAANEQARADVEDLALTCSDASGSGNHIDGVSVVKVPAVLNIVYRLRAALGPAGTDRQEPK